MKILVLNNDLAERTLIEQVLIQNGHGFAAAENSEDAFQQLQQGEIRFVIRHKPAHD